MTKKRLIALIIFSLAVIACSDEPEPAKVGPNGSWWVGGSDGGAYIFVEDDNNPDDGFYQGAVYYDADQSLWYNGAFEYEGPPGFDYTDRSHYLGWDGEGIILRDNAYLRAVDPIPPL